MEDEILEMLENINTRLDAVEATGVSESTEEKLLTYIETQEKPENWYDVVQNLGIVGILGIFVLGPILMSRYGKKQEKNTDKIYQSLNGYGTREDGSKITLADTQRYQIKIEKENRALLYTIARKMGIKKNDL